MISEGQATCISSDFAVHDLDDRKVKDMAMLGVPCRARETCARRAAGLGKIDAGADAKDAVDRLVFYGNNGFGDDFGKRQARSILTELRRQGNLDGDLLLDE